jgi:hypothetical protein
MGISGLAIVAEQQVKNLPGDRVSFTASRPLL